MPELKQKPNSRACSSRIVSGMHPARATQYQAYVEACRCHTELSHNVPPFLTLHSVDQGASITTDTPFIWCICHSLHIDGNIHILLIVVVVIALLSHAKDGNRRNATAACSMVSSVLQNATPTNSSDVPSYAFSLRRRDATAH